MPHQPSNSVAWLELADADQPLSWWELMGIQVLVDHQSLEGPLAVLPLATAEAVVSQEVPVEVPEVVTAVRVEDHLAVATEEEGPPLQVEVVLQVVRRQVRHVTLPCFRILRLLRGEEMEEEAGEMEVAMVEDTMVLPAKIIDRKGKKQRRSHSQRCLLYQDFAHGSLP